MCQALERAKEIKQCINKVPACGAHNPTINGYMCEEEITINKQVNKEMSDGDKYFREKYNILGRIKTFKVIFYIG